MALLSEAPTRPGVSVDLNVSFMRAAKRDSYLTIEGRLLKVGKALAFTEVDLYERREDGSRGKLIASGRHTKAC